MIMFYCPAIVPNCVIFYLIHFKIKNEYKYLFRNNLTVKYDL